jgi:CheY-like chemotaxis protein
LVDENITGAEILGKLLKELELDLLTASSGRMCLNILNNNPNIDLIILDNDLSDTKPDLLVGSIKSAKAYLDCPILMINYANVKEIRSDKLADSIIRINKPIKHSQLITYIQKIFIGKKSSQTHHVIHTPQIQKLNGTYPLNILVAEDNAINQKLITRLFEMLGYNIHIAANGYEAIKAVNNMNIDIIFMDIQMPEMDGIEATKQICAKWGSNKPLIVAMTANALQNDKEKCIEAGMDDYMSKPLTIDQVSTRIEKWSLLCNRSRLDSQNI